LAGQSHRRNAFFLTRRTAFIAGFCFLVVPAEPSRWAAQFPFGSAFHPREKKTPTSPSFPLLWRPSLKNVSLRYCWGRPVFDATLLLHPPLSPPALSLRSRPTLAGLARSVMQVPERFLALRWQSTICIIFCRVSLMDSPSPILFLDLGPFRFRLFKSRTPKHCPRSFAYFARPRHRCAPSSPQPNAHP